VRQLSDLLLRQWKSILDVAPSEPLRNRVMLALIYERRAEFVVGFKNRAWHIEKVKREYGITENFRFSPLFPRRRLPRGGSSKTTPIYQ